MKNSFSTLVTAFFIAVPATAIHAAGLSWHSPLRVVECDVPSSSGLKGVWVARSLEGVSVGYTPQSGNPADVRWLRFGNAGAAYAEPVTSGVSLSGSESILSSLNGDTGYIVEADGVSTYFWVVDYSDYPLELNSITPSPEQDCSTQSLDISGKGDEIAYYTINGRRLALSRDIRLQYTTLTYDTDAGVYNSSSVEQSLEYLQPTVHVPAPLCDTAFTLSGDRFLSAWEEEERIESPAVDARAIACESTAVQEERDSENEVNTGSSGGAMGGSAPCIVHFTAAVTDAAIFHEWQFSRDSEFEDVNMRVTDLDFDYTFNEEGTTYVRLYCANADASCDVYGPVYDVSIGTSMLKCPNAFSPFNQDGVNDEWKVSYSSIISFECSIFNRYGHEIVTFNDPSHGWDGKSGGKFVPAGVYYYVISAKGADGKEYKLSGDVNILDYK